MRASICSVADSSTGFVNVFSSAWSKCCTNNTYRKQIIANLYFANTVNYNDVCGCRSLYFQSKSEMQRSSLVHNSTGIVAIDSPFVFVVKFGSASPATVYATFRLGITPASPTTADRLAALFDLDAFVALTCKVWMFVSEFRSTSSENSFVYKQVLWNLILEIDNLLRKKLLHSHWSLISLPNASK